MPSTMVNSLFQMCDKGNCVGIVQQLKRNLLHGYKVHVWAINFVVKTMDGWYGMGCNGMVCQGSVWFMACGSWMRLCFFSSKRFS